MEIVGFIGLGNLGGPVAGHIQSAGFPLVVYDLRPEAMRPFRERGATVATSAAELAGLCDMIITALPMPQDIEQIARQLVDGIKPGAIYIDISTGPPDIFERAKPVFNAFGDQVRYAGPLGSGSICKLVHQMINSTISQAIAEGLTLGVKAGVDVTSLWECVRRGMVGRMHVLHAQVPQNVFRDHYETDTFPLKLLRKDVGLATALGRELNVSLPLANITEQKLIEGINRGWGDKSAYTVTFKLQEEAAQIALRAEGVDPERSGKYISTHPDVK